MASTRPDSTQVTLVPILGLTATNVRDALIELNTTKAAADSPVLVGIPVAPTASLGTNTNQLATTEFVLANIPIIDVMEVVVVTATTQLAVPNTHYVLTNIGATTVTLPALPTIGDVVVVTPDNSLSANIVARNSQTIMGLAEDLVIDSATVTITLKFVNNSWRLV